MKHISTSLILLLISTSVSATDLLVTNNLDSGPGSLRAIIADAQDGDTVEFDPSLAGQTIFLISGSILISDDITITGLGVDQLTISGNNQSRIFDVAFDADVTMSDLSLTDGSSQTAGGGAISMTGSSLELINMVFSNNQSSGFGGALVIAGTSGSEDQRITTIINSTFSSNSATTSGAAIFTNGPLTIIGSTISTNSAGDAGAVVASFTDLVISDSTIVNNTASNTPGISLLAPESTLQIGNSIVANNTSTAAEISLDIGSFVPETTDGQLSLVLPVKGQVSSEGGNFIGSFVDPDEVEEGSIFNQPNDQTGTPDAPIDSLLGPLQVNSIGLPTHLPLVDSPVIDAGVPSDQPTDQRGLPRVAGNGIDIGAVELQPASLVSSLSGSWFVEGLNTQGFLVNIGENDEGEFLFMSWFTYLEGAPFWLVGSTNFVPGQSSITLDMQSFEGADFLDFDVEPIQQDLGGTMVLTVTGCDAIDAQVDFGALAVTEFTMQRLTSTAGLVCLFDPQ